MNEAEQDRSRKLEKVVPGENACLFESIVRLQLHHKTNPNSSWGPAFCLTKSVPIHGDVPCVVAGVASWARRLLFD